MCEEVSGRKIKDIEFFDILAIGRRILDVSSPFASGLSGRACALEPSIL